MRTFNRNKFTILLFLLVLVLVFGPRQVFATELDMSPGDGSDRGPRDVVFWKIDDDLLKTYPDHFRLLEILSSWSEDRLDKMSSRYVFHISNKDSYKLNLDLKPGVYYMRDLTSPRGDYWLVDNIIVVGEDAPPLIKIKWTKDTIPPPPETPPGEVLLYKTDDRGNPLKAVVFNLYDENGNPVRTKNYVYDPDGEVEDLVTDEKGYIRVTNLPKGTYKFVEVRTLPGYEIERGSSYVKVDYDTGGFVHVVNKRLKGEVNFIKIDGETKEPLAGAVFKIYRIVDGERVFVKDGEGKDLVAISDADGSYGFKDLDFGLYYVVEVQAPFGYILSQDEIEVIVNSESYSKLVEVKNFKKPGDEDEDDDDDFEMIHKKKIVKVGDITLIVMFIAGAIFVLIGRFFIKSEDSK